MNTILQKRIEEAKKEYEDSLSLPEWDRKEIHGIDFMKGATFALQNQWISVEEALPEYDIPVIAVDYVPEMYWESPNIMLTHRSKNSDMLKDSNDFCIYPPAIPEITYWMEIPKLKEK